MTLSSTSLAAVSAMRPTVLVVPLAVWVGLAVLAVANGVFRELVLIPRIGDYPGHVLSTLVLVATILVAAWAFFATTTTDYRTAELAAVGVAWTVLTVGFEFLVGHLEGTPVSVTVGQYDVFAGQVWILVPLTLLVAPLLFGHVLATG